MKKQRFSTEQIVSVLKQPDQSSRAVQLRLDDACRSEARGGPALRRRDGDRRCKIEQLRCRSHVLDRPRSPTLTASKRRGACRSQNVLTAAAPKRSCSPRVISNLEDIPVRWIAETGAQTFTQGFDLRCRPMVTGISEKKLCAFGWPANIHDRQQALADFLVDEEAWQQGQPQTRQCRITHHDAVVDPQRRFGPNNGPACSDSKSPIA